MIADVLSAVLAEHTVEDVSVEDPPLEEVIAEMFSLVGEQADAKPSRQRELRIGRVSEARR